MLLNQPCERELSLIDVRSDHPKCIKASLLVIICQHFEWRTLKDYKLRDRLIINKNRSIYLHYH